MESTPSHKDAMEPTPLTGELIVQNGRLKGTCRSLDGPMTFIGKAPSCDVRLNVEGINSLHCVIVQSDGDFLLRDLETTTGTTVNGQRVSQCVLSDEDQITIGPFQFRVRLAHQEEPSDSGLIKKKFRGSIADVVNHREREGLRIQAAAVAAQQAALTELELRLAQREKTLEKQQAQLAEHLEEKRQRLLELHSRTQAARQSLEKDKEDYQRHLEEITQDLTTTEKELLDEKQKVEAERKRLAVLRQRLRQRFRRHWAGQQAELESWEQNLSAAYKLLEKDHEQLAAEKSQFAQTCLQFNSDLEIGKRKLDLAWEELHKKESQTEAYFKIRVEEIENREASLVEAESLLEAERERHRREVEDLKFETFGLEARIRNQRRVLAGVASVLDNKRLCESINESRCLYPIMVIPPEEHFIEHWLGPAGAEYRKHLVISPKKLTQPAENEAVSIPFELITDLEQQAGELLDQRFILTEQLHQLLDTIHHWRLERSSVADAMMSVLQELQQRAYSLVDREEQLGTQQLFQEQRHEELARWRQRLIGWQMQLKSEHGAVKAEQDRRTIEIVAREEAVSKQLDQLFNLSETWKIARQREVESFQRHAESCEKAVQEYSALCEERRQQIKQLEQDRLELTKKELVIEEYRKECLNRSTDVRASERRLDRLERRWSMEVAEALRQSQEECRDLETRMAHYQEKVGDLQASLDRLNGEKQSMLTSKYEWERDRLSLGAEATQLREQVQCLQEQRDLTEQRSRELQSEIERVARVLMDELDPPVAELEEKLQFPDTPSIRIDKAA